MKVQCDACQSAEASVFCCADEAALCLKCDSKVHDANKFASKHHRLSLLEPLSSTSSDSPLCDICQERRAFFFCQADRAVLCRDCDFSIHSANELTAKHIRFLVPGTSVTLKPMETSSCPDKVAATAIVTKAPVPPVQRMPDHAQPSMDLPVEAVTSTSNSSFSQYLSEVEQFLTSASPDRLDWGGSSEGDAIGKYMDSDWASNLSLLPECFYGDTLAEVPHMPSPITDSGLCVYSRFGVPMKPKAKQQQQNQVPYFLDGFDRGDDNFTVPDIRFAPSAKRMRMSNTTLHDQQFFII